MSSPSHVWIGDGACCGSSRKLGCLATAPVCIAAQVQKYPNNAHHMCEPDVRIDCLADLLIVRIVETNSAGRFVEEFLPRCKHIVSRAVCYDPSSRPEPEDDKCCGCEKADKGLCCSKCSHYHAPRSVGLVWPFVVKPELERLGSRSVSSWRILCMQPDYHLVSQPPLTQSPQCCSAGQGNQDANMKVGKGAKQCSNVDFRRLASQRDNRKSSLP